MHSFYIVAYPNFPTITRNPKFHHRLILLFFFYLHFSGMMTALGHLRSRGEKLLDVSVPDIGWLPSQSPLTCYLTRLPSSFLDLKEATRKGIKFQKSRIHQPPRLLLLSKTLIQLTLGILLCSERWPSTGIYSVASSVPA